MTNVADTTAYTKEKMRQIAKPVGWIWRGIKGGVSVGSKAIIY